MSKQKWLMPEEKAKRIAVGAIVAGVLIVLFLLSVIIVQFVQISAANRENDRIQKEIDRYQELIEEGEKNLEHYESELWMYQQAVSQGWSTP